MSSNSNIQKIKTNLENISQKFGEKIEYKNQEFFLFPDAKMLSKVSITEIKSCGVGYRAKFIKEASKIFASEKIVIDDLKCSIYAINFGFRYILKFEISKMFEYLEFLIYMIIYKFH